jgi:CRP/FNR family cyclic AMP-dependent transcriptional regulator
MIGPTHYGRSARHALAELPLLAGLSSVELDALAEQCSLRHVAPGDLLFSEGEEPRGLVVVKDGAGEVFLERHRRERVGEFTAGEVFAVAATMTGRCHLASARALVACEIVRIPPWEARRLCRRNPEIALRLADQMEARIARLLKRMSWMAGEPPLRSRMGDRRVPARPAPNRWDGQGNAETRVQLALLAE